MNWYRHSIDNVLKKLHVKVTEGLSTTQVEERQKQFGRNELLRVKRISRWLLFVRQFKDFMVLVLLGATLLAAVFGEYIDAIAIMVIVLVNGLIGYFQETKAETSLEKLKSLTTPVVRVLRNRHWMNIPSTDLVIGDIIYIEQGGRIAADIRLIESHQLEVEESALTGESIPVLKEATAKICTKTDIQDQRNMVFTGTLITKGNATGVVVATGMKTAMGQIATMMTSTKKVQTPLEYRLDQLGKILITVALLLTTFVVVLGIIQGHPIYDMLLSGISLAVAAIPEGLPAIVTVVLSLGVQRMIRQKAIVRDLRAIETLGSISVICSDKTGTLTENKMTVRNMFTSGSMIAVTGNGYEATGEFLYDKQKGMSEKIEQMLLYGALCNNAHLQVKKGQFLVTGDPTDGALLVASRKKNITLQKTDQYRLIKEIPFDSNRKRMSVIVEDPNGDRLLITKGAPDTIVSRCDFQHKNQTKTEIDQAIKTMANDALRTIAIAVRRIRQTDDIDELLERNLTFIGLFGLLDPPRKEVRQAMKECKEAGIRTVMITGDHKDTAKAIGKEIGLFQKDDRVLTGNQLNQLRSSELVDIIDEVSIFARVSPKDKLKIVHAFQERGHIVAMTGDGVNDAPAIKASDVGISMGMTGTDVAKEASSLILLDDNFSTIRSAIREGRNIYENIRKFIRYLLASNVGEILAMLFAILLQMPLPLTPVQILWVNLVTDGLPAIALGMDTPENELMKRKPRERTEGIFSRGLGFKIISRGILIGLVTIITFVLAYYKSAGDLTYARTVAFSTLVTAQLIHVFDCRSERAIFARNPLENIPLNLSVISSFALLLVVVYMPSLQPIFHTIALSLMDWMVVIFFSLIPTIFFLFSKKA